LTSSPTMPRAVLCALVLLFASFAALDLWAVLVDRRPSVNGDSIPSQVAEYQLALRNKLVRPYVHPGQGAWSLLWVIGMNKPPLATALAFPLTALLGDHTRAARLLSLAFRYALIGLVFLLGRRLGRGRPLVGVVAALIVAALPSSFGWGRMDYRESMVTCLIAATQLAMLRTRDRRVRSAIVLGVAIALGSLTSLPYLAFVSPALLFFVLSNLGRRGGLRTLLIAGSIGAAVFGSWLVLNIDMVLQNLDNSFTPSTLKGPSWARIYATTLPDFVPLVVLGLLSRLVLFWLPGSSRDDLRLQTISAVGGLALLGLIMPWSRYAVLIYPSLALLVAAMAGRVLDPGPSPSPAPPDGERRLGFLARALPRRVLLTVFAVGLLGQATALTLAGPLPRNRERGMGLVRPDRRSFDAFHDALIELGPYREELLVIFGTSDDYGKVVGFVSVSAILRVKGIEHHLGTLADAWHAKHRYGVLIVSSRLWDWLRVLPFQAELPPEQIMGNERGIEQWYMKHKRRKHVYTRKDHDGLLYEAFIVDEKL
jgi:hypothetical protein